MKILGGNWPSKPPVPTPMLTAPCSTIIATLLQVFFVTFTASYCQHDSFPDSSCNFRGFIHNFSPGLSCSCHGFMLHCQHGSSLDLLDNLPSFCQLSSDCLLCSSYNSSNTARVHSCLKFTCSHLLKSREISCDKYMTQ